MLTVIEWIMLQVDGLVKNPSPSPDLPDLPDEDTYGVPVVSGEMDFFRPILARVWKDFWG